MDGNRDHRRDRGRRRGSGHGTKKQAQMPKGNQQTNLQQPNRSHVKAQATEKPAPKPKPISYDVVFYDTHADAKRDKEQLEQRAKATGQLNIVIRAEGDMDDPELLQFGKVYAGAAWTLIHERRVSEGWYLSKH